jgi:hypothetical protein
MSFEAALYFFQCDLVVFGLDNGLDPALISFAPWNTLLFVCHVDKYGRTSRGMNRAMATASPATITHQAPIANPRGGVTSVIEVGPAKD